MAKARKNYHVGGQQLPLITPDSDWKPPKELPDLRKHKLIAEDTETKDEGLAAGVGPSWPFRGGHVAGFGLAWKGGSGYFPTNHPDTECFQPDQVKRWHEDHYKAGVRFAFHNAPYDLGWMQADFGIAPPPSDQIEDTTAMAVMLDENRRDLDLDSLAETMGVPGKDVRLLNEAAAAYGVDPKSGLWMMPGRFVGTYGAADAVSTLGLVHKMAPMLAEEDTTAAYRLECDLIPMCLEMRRRGIRIDLDKAEQARVELEAVSHRCLKELSEKLGHTVGLDEIRSNAFKVRACTDMKIFFPTTGQGAASFSKDWMRGHEHWFPRLVDQVIQYEDAANKFLRNYVIGFCHNGRIHAGINQFMSEDGGTRSHRFSYSNPPLQQMPMRAEIIAKLVRGAFLPEPGEWWLAADYSQQEYRLIVHFAELLKCSTADVAGDKYRADPKTDFHSMVAEMTGLERKPAKDSNFAKAFGAGVAKFALMIGKTVEEAQAIYEQYDEEMPFVSELAEKCNGLANRRGYIKLLDGARSHFDLWEASFRKKNFDEHGRYIAPMPIEKARKRPEWKGERLRRAFTHKAMNRLIQGSAARMTKLAMRACWREGLVPMLQMHDELDFSVSSEDQGKRVTEIMRDIVKLSVPVNVDAEYGATWGLAKSTWADRAKGAAVPTRAAARRPRAGAGAKRPAKAAKRRA